MAGPLPLWHGYAMQFSSGGFLKVGEERAVDLADEREGFSIEGWFYPDHGDKVQSLLHKGKYPSAQYAVAIGELMTDSYMCKVVLSLSGSDNKLLAYTSDPASKVRSEVKSLNTVTPNEVK